MTAWSCLGSRGAHSRPRPGPGSPTVGRGGRRGRASAGRGARCVALRSWLTATGPGTGGGRPQPAGTSAVPGRSTLVVRLWGWTAADGVGERTADHEVDFVDGLGRIGMVAVRRVEHRAVQRFEVLGPESTDSLAADGGEDVSLRVAGVAPVGARLHGEFLGRQPLRGQVGAEGERPDLGPGRAGPQKLSTLDRFLPPWLGAAIALDMPLGELFPGLDETFDRINIDTVSLPIASGRCWSVAGSVPWAWHDGTDGRVRPGRGPSLHARGNRCRRRSGAVGAGRSDADREVNFASFDDGSRRRRGQRQRRSRRRPWRRTASRHGHSPCGCMLGNPGGGAGRAGPVKPPQDVCSR